MTDPPIIIMLFFTIRESVTILRPRPHSRGRSTPETKSLCYRSHLLFQTARGRGGNG